MDAVSVGHPHHLRFHAPHAHLASAFGADAFGAKAEAFARFFGTPTFLITQTFVVGAWIAANAVGFARFDLYPFILLAQTRQADRDKAHAEADALHREALAAASAERQALAATETQQLMALLRQNTELTRVTQELSERIEKLTAQVHGKVMGA
jgi:uncharacterized membrane protein